MKINYTDYCTCFTDTDEKGRFVQFYDEIKDKPIATVRVESKDEALRVMEDWVGKAPPDVICQRI